MTDAPVSAAVMRLFQAALDSEQRIHLDSDRAAEHADRALATLSLVRRAVPDRPDVAAAVARVLDRLGRPDEGLRVLEPHLRADRPWTPVVQAYGRLAPGCGQTARAIAMLRRAVAEPAAGAKTEPLHYELAVLLDLEGDSDAAFAAALAANRLTARRLGALPVRPLAELVADVAGRPRPPRPEAGFPSRLPVFVVGFGRSGKTVLEALLAAHPGIAALGERRLAVPRLVQSLGSRMTRFGLPPVGRAWEGPRLRSAGRDFVTRLAAAAPGAARAIDTAPENGLALPAIDAALPGATFLHLVRDPRDTCLDMFFHFQKSRLMRAWDLAEGARSWCAYRRLMRMWRERFGVRLAQIRYERMVTSPAPVRSEALRLLGLTPVDRPAELVRPRVDPAGRIDRSRTVEDRHVGRWRRYGRHIGPLLEVFGDADEPVIPTADG
ncbi:sulfotransferase [Stella sp.]|uniref:sulfotransferase n=1 Tax=Stella sp. TaxID=2912054 RepID=UPI0035B065CB